MMDVMSLYICLKPIKCTTPRVNPKVNYGFGVIMMCQCRFILGNKCTTLVSDADNEESCTGVGAGGIW